jgi:hypothetical protein
MDAGRPSTPSRDGCGDISLAAGQTTSDHIAWSVPRDGAYMITPVLYQGLLYVCKNNGVFKVFDAATGAEVYQQRLGDGTTGFTASLVAADGKVYFTSEDGDVFVVKAGRTFELLAKNRVGETGMATPAISEGTLTSALTRALLRSSNGRRASCWVLCALCQERAGVCQHLIKCWPASAPTERAGLAGRSGEARDAIHVPAFVCVSDPSDRVRVGHSCPTEAARSTDVSTTFSGDRPHKMVCTHAVNRRGLGAEPDGSAVRVVGRGARS